MVVKIFGDQFIESGNMLSIHIWAGFLSFIARQEVNGW